MAGRLAATALLAHSVPMTTSDRAAQPTGRTDLPPGGATGGTPQTRVEGSEEELGERHVAPIRWPKPTRGGLALFALWAGGAAFGMVLPAMLVSPSSEGASTGLLLAAFGLTVVGVLIMVAACAIAFRRGRDGAIIIFAIIPTGVLLAGGMMLLGTKLFSAST